MHALARVAVERIIIHTAAWASEIVPSPLRCTESPASKEMGTFGAIWFATKICNEVAATPHGFGEQS